MTPPTDVALAALLVELFDAEELQRFLRSHYREIADCLPVNLGLLPLANAAAEALARRNLVDEALFSRLHERRPRCARRIDMVAHARDRIDDSPAPGRWRWWAAMVVALGGVATLAALLLPDAPLVSAQCEPTAGCAYEVARDVPGHSNESREDASRRAPPILRCPEGMTLIDDVGAADPICLDRTEVTRRAFCSSITGSAKVDPREKHVAGRCVRDSEIIDWLDHPIVHVRPGEALAYCAERGLRLPDRQTYVRVLRAERDRWGGVDILHAVNVCGVECHRNQRPDVVEFTHRDPHDGTAAVGSYRRRFASVRDLDDIFGNVREMVREGTQIYACGSGWAHVRFAELDPETCVAPENRPLDAGSSSQMLGFRCAGEPVVEVLDLSGTRAGN